MKGGPVAVKEALTTRFNYDETDKVAVLLLVMAVLVLSSVPFLVRQRRKSPSREPSCGQTARRRFT